jgi:uncharacterized membrane protein YgaE (UPF0421/DUF939 family)
VLEPSLARLRSAWLAAALASLAAAIAWLLAHRVLGHPQPFFAPIAAAISLSTSQTQRSRRIVQMVAGVLLGIGVGELLAAAIGTSTTALGLIVFLTLALALLSGIGVFGEGLMFANQAAASAILVVTLHRHGTGSERAIDALVGGATGFVLGVVLFPAHPMQLLHRAERAVIRTLAETLEEALVRLHDAEPADEAFALDAGYRIHQQLAALAAARATARANVRVAPRRWKLRAVVDAENARTAQLDLFAGAILGLIRTITAESGDISPGLVERLNELMRLIKLLAGTPQPWPQHVLNRVRGTSATIASLAEATGVEREQAVTAVLSAAATGLSHVLETRN